MAPAPERWRRNDLIGASAGVGAAIVALMIVLFDDDAGFGAGQHRWFIPVSIASGGLVGAAFPLLRRVAPVPGAGAGAVVVALAGTYLCVPETDQFRTVYWLPIGVLVLELVTFRPLDLAWYGAAAVPIVWAGMSGMTDRFSAMAGMLFAWWTPVMVGLVSLIRPLRPSSMTALVVTALGMFAAVVGVRTGGIVDDRTSSILQLAVVAGGSVAVGALIAGVGSRAGGAG